MLVSFTIPGKPFAKQRPRATARGGFARVFTPKETVSFERQVGQIAAQHFPRPLAGPVRLVVTAVFEVPASWSKKRRAEAMGGHHTQRPDLDNCLKALKDGLNRIAWADDCQVAEVSCRKLWGDGAETIVQVEALA
jgi:Holliday junction resolvase RusA-like endonuclease